MAGWLWLTCRHRPSEPRLVCDLILPHRPANGADSGRIGSACRLAQAAAAAEALVLLQPLLMLLLLLQRVQPLLMLLLLLQRVQPLLMLLLLLQRVQPLLMLLRLLCQLNQLHTGRVTAADPAPYLGSPKRNRPMRNQVMNIPGTAGFAIPTGAKPVGIAGETAWFLVEGDKCRLWVKVGAAAGTVLASSKLRHGTSRVTAQLRNRRNTAAGAAMTLAKGQWFEAKGYSRISQWKRYSFDGQNIVAG